MTQSNTKKAEKLKQSANDIVGFYEKLHKTKEIFPKLDIIYSAVGVFGEDAYKRVIMAYKDPELTKLLADYFEELVGHEFPGTDIWSLYMGVGNTDEIRKQYLEIDTPPEKRTAKSERFRRGPNGLHPKILSAIDGRDAGYLKREVIPKRLGHIFNKIAKNARNLIEAYTEGNRQAMFEALPAIIRVQHDHNIASEPHAMAELSLEDRIKYVPDTIKEFNVPDGISADDLHRIGKWLTEVRKTTKNKPLNNRIPFDCVRAGEWLQATFPAHEKSSQNIAISSVIKDAKSNKR